MHDNICSRTRFGSSLDALPALQTHRHSGIGRDGAVLSQRHGTIARRTWVVGTSLKPEPLVAALWAAQWCIRSRRRPPSIFDSYDGAHEGR